MPLDFKSIATFAQQVTSKSAINPTLWACAVISLPLFILTATVSGWRAVAFFIVALIPPSLFLGSYIYMLCKNPKLLRSEDFHLRADAMGLFGDKDNPMQAEAAHVIAVITNPALPSPDEQKLMP